VTLQFDVDESAHRKVLLAPFESWNVAQFPLVQSAFALHASQFPALPLPQAAKAAHDAMTAMNSPLSNTFRTLICPSTYASRRH
jgi:hypothetical protein